jgi:hypothetical protein
LKIVFAGEFFLAIQPSVIPIATSKICPTGSVLIAAISGITNVGIAISE